MGERFQKMCNEHGCIERTSDRSDIVRDTRMTIPAGDSAPHSDKERHQTAIAKLYNARWVKLKEMLRHGGFAKTRKTGSDARA